MAMSATVKDVYSKEFNTVLENDSASRCLEGFKKGLPPVLAVLNDKGKYVGMVSRRSVLRSRLDLSRIKVKNLMVAAPEAGLGDSLSRVAKLMINSGVRQLPVFDKGRLIGFITDEAVIHAVVGGEWGSNRIETIMTRAPHTLEANRSVGAVLSLMREFGVSHVPIMDNGRLVGLVSIQDILENLYWPPKRQGNKDVAGEQIDTLAVPARGIMSSPVITVNPATILRDAEQQMHNHDVSCLCVVDGERLVGVVTKLDFLEPISQLETAERRLTVQFGVKGVDVSPEQQEYMMTEFDSFSRRFQEAFQLGTLFVYMKSHGTSNMRGTPLLHCRLQFRTVRGTFVAASEGWGVEPTFKVALDRLERRLLRSKELLAFNPRYARDYLRKIGLPQEET
ncbi:MAG: CBS domain-containing protein [Candidatus Bathyarchaeota archaeon]|nr:CBS domain-containing protein [Candidatus Bathyarchaeota archaeon]